MERLAESTDLRLVVIAQANMIDDLEKRLGVLEKRRDHVCEFAGSGSSPGSSSSSSLGSNNCLETLDGFFINGKFYCGNHNPTVRPPNENENNGYVVYQCSSSKCRYWFSSGTVVNSKFYCNQHCPPIAKL